MFSPNVSIDLGATAVASIQALTLKERGSGNDQVPDGAAGGRPAAGPDGTAGSGSDAGPGGAYSNSDTSSLNDGSVEASLLETFLANNPLSGGPEMRMDGFPKPQICFDFTKGVCTRGDKCKYSHDLATIVSFNSKEKGICFDYLRNQCTRGLLCRFSHDLSNIAQQVYNGASMHAGANPGQAKLPLPSLAGKPMAICYDFVKGVCQRGAECRYSHDLSLIARMARGGPAAPTPKTAEICYDYLRGRCNRGATCKYSHNISFLSAPGMVGGGGPPMGAPGAQVLAPQMPGAVQQHGGGAGGGGGMGVMHGHGMSHGLASSISADQATLHALASANAIERSRSMSTTQERNDTASVNDQPHPWAQAPHGGTLQPGGYGGMPNGAAALQANNTKLMAMQQALLAAAAQQQAAHAAAAQQHQQQRLAMAAAAGLTGMPRMGMHMPNMGMAPEHMMGPNQLMGGGGMGPGGPQFHHQPSSAQHGMPDGRAFSHMPMMGGMGQQQPMAMAQTDRIAALLGVSDRHMLADTLSNMAAMAKAQAAHGQGPAGMPGHLSMGPMQQPQQKGGMAGMPIPHQQGAGPQMVGSYPQSIPSRGDAGDLGSYPGGPVPGQDASSAPAGTMLQHDMLPLIKDIWASKP